MLPPIAKPPPSSMITFFTLPKPFVGHIGMIQRNAIQSWTRLHPDVDILMFGDEQGTAEVAAEFGIRHFPDVEVNEYGTPRMSGYFQQAEEVARYPRMCYVNAGQPLPPAGSTRSSAVCRIRSRPHPGSAVFRTRPRCPRRPVHCRT